MHLKHQSPGRLPALTWERFRDIFLWKNKYTKLLIKDFTFATAHIVISGLLLYCMLLLLACSLVYRLFNYCIISKFYFLRFDEGKPKDLSGLAQVIFLDVTDEEIDEISSNMPECWPLKDIVIKGHFRCFKHVKTIINTLPKMTQDEF